MARVKGIRKPVGDILSWSKEQQARFIERETQNLIKRLPKLKSSLQMYGEISDELYNMTSDELQLIGSTYSRAVRSGEISTPSSKKAYQDFIRKLKRYSRTDIRQLALETAEQRLDSWLEHVRANASDKEYEYAKDLIEQITDSDKIGFTLSKYFLDTENWSSEGYFQDTSIGQMSIQVLKLELYMEEKGYTTSHYYINDVETDKSKDHVSKLRKYTRHRNKGD